MGGGPRIDTTEDEIGERGKLPAAGATRTTEKKQVGESTKKYKRSAQKMMRTCSLTHNRDTHRPGVEAEATTARAVECRPPPKKDRQPAAVFGGGQ